MSRINAYDFDRVAEQLDEGDKVRLDFSGEIEEYNHEHGWYEYFCRRSWDFVDTIESMDNGDITFEDHDVVLKLGGGKPAIKEDHEWWVSHNNKFRSILWKRE